MQNPKPLTYRQARALFRMGNSRRSAEVLEILFGIRPAVKAEG